jgi:CheY-like chemotaxis protein
MTFSILVVDDEPDIAKTFRQRFRHEVRQGTYVLHYAASGEEALDTLADRVRPERIVILSDINMPGMDGLTLLREVKQLRPDLPVMMVTAYGDDERRRVHHQAGRFRPLERATTAAAGDGRMKNLSLRQDAEYAQRPQKGP